MMDKGQNIKEILLPELGEGVKEGEFLKWHVGVGDLIKIDQGLCDVHTDKASLEVPSPCDGRVIELRARKGDTLHVGQVLLLVNLERQVDIIPKEEEKNPNTKQKKTNQDKTKQEDIPSIYPETNKPKVQTFFDPPSSVDESKNKNKEPEEGILTQPDKGVLALPYTRKLAKELGIDLKKIKGSGLFGRITKEDVLKQKEPYNMREDIEEEVKGLREWSFEKQNLRLGFRVPRLPLQDRVPLKGIRKVISERLTLSKKMIPHFSLMDSANVDKLVHIRSSLKERLKEENIKLSYLAFILKALLLTVKKFPELNASVDDISKEQVFKRYYHFGLAVDTPRGLMVPVIKDVDKKSIKRLCIDIQSLAQKARDAKLKPDEMKDASLTITNVGSLGGKYGTPVINPPEALILGVYRLHVSPQWKKDHFVPVQTMNFSFTADHRIIDGATAARGLSFFIKTIEDPLALFL